ncbi:carotenoid biosynthesis protein [Balneolales bacterium ANBcel1]|nr:carotenoid biosynthesis protein [Balneolales bacterium ANBcel1]
MEKMNILARYGKYGVIYIIFLVGVAGHLIEAVRPLMLAMTPYTLLVMSSYVLWFAMREAGPVLMVWGAVVFAATFLLEAAGVYTGLLFGTYEYGDVLGSTILGVPPIIGLNWVMVVLGAAGIAGRFLKRPLPAALATAVLAVAFDFIMEPVAIQLGYWSWGGNGDIPLQNYGMWAVASFVLSWPLFRIPIRHTMPVVIHYFFALALFFAILLAVKL